MKNRDYAKYTMDIDFIQFEDGIYPEITSKPLLLDDDLQEYVELIDKITYLFNRTLEQERGTVK